MKKTLLLLCLLSVTGAFGQSVGGVLSAEPQHIEVPSHDQHAFQQTMGEERTLLISGNNLSGHGVRPLWELMPVHHEVPLGDTARMLKQQHAAAKKAEIVWEN